MAMTYGCRHHSEASTVHSDKTGRREFTPCLEFEPSELTGQVSTVSAPGTPSSKRGLLL
jgi:hypothetical protein